jgi:hypothetical protein
MLTVYISLVCVPKYDELFRLWKVIWKRGLMLEVAIFNQNDWILYLHQIVRFELLQHTVAWRLGAVV